VPEAVVYYFPTVDHHHTYFNDRSEVGVSERSLFTENELVPLLFREEDGHFRSDIVLSPFAVTERETVIEVCLRNSGWTNMVITGAQAFPHEPFQLSGPALPPSWRDGDPTPMVSLPKLRVGKLA
jgi:hypothetical protein